MLISCKQATDLVSQSFEQDLNWKEKFSLRFHLLLCRLCSRYARQIEFLHGILHEEGQPDALAHDPEPRLSDEAREHIKETLLHAKK